MKDELNINKGSLDLDLKGKATVQLFDKDTGSLVYEEVKNNYVHPAMKRYFQNMFLRVMHNNFSSYGQNRTSLSSDPMWGADIPYHYRTMLLINNDEPANPVTDYVVEGTVVASATLGNTTVVPEVRGVFNETESVLNTKGVNIKMVYDFPTNVGNIAPINSIYLIASDALSNRGYGGSYGHTLHSWGGGIYKMSCLGNDIFIYKVVGSVCKIMKAPTIIKPNQWFDLFEDEASVLYQVNLSTSSVSSLANDGTFLYHSNRQFIYKYDLSTGALVSSFTLPTNGADNYFSTHGTVFDMVNNKIITSGTSYRVGINYSHYLLIYNLNGSVFQRYTTSVSQSDSGRWTLSDNIGVVNKDGKSFFGINNIYYKNDVFDVFYPCKSSGVIVDTTNWLTWACDGSRVYLTAPSFFSRVKLDTPINKQENQTMKIIYELTTTNNVSLI